MLLSNSEDFSDLPFTIGEVYRSLTRDDGPQYLKRTIEEAGQRSESYSWAVNSSLGDYLAGSENLVNAVRCTVTARLETWNNRLIDQATSESDFDRRDNITLLVGVAVERLVQFAGRIIRNHRRGAAIQQELPHRTAVVCRVR